MKTRHIRGEGLLELRGGFIDDISTIAQLPLATDLQKTP